MINVAFQMKQTVTAALHGTKLNANGYLRSRCMFIPQLGEPGSSNTCFTVAAIEKHG